MKKRERLIVAIPNSLEELQNELARFPQKDRAARLRELAWMGLAMMKGVPIVQTQAPQQAPQGVPQSPITDEGEARRIKMAKFKGPGGVMGGMG